MKHSLRGVLHPASSCRRLVPDIPPFRASAPRTPTFIQRSLPAGTRWPARSIYPPVQLASDVEEERFLLLLRHMGFTTFTRPASHYASHSSTRREATLWELAADSLNGT
jgi:hypothetical protein